MRRHRATPFVVLALLVVAAAAGAQQTPDTPPATQDPPATQNPPATQDPPPAEPRGKDEPDPDDPLADRYADPDPSELDDDESWMDEPTGGDVEALPPEPGAFERWLRLGQLKIRNRLEWRYRRYTSRGFNEPIVPIVPEGTERDSEMRNFLEIETRGLIAPNINSYVSFDYRKDIDGTREVSFFKNIVTSFDDRELIRFYTAWVEAVDVADIMRVRVGRQFTHEVHPVTFDGVSAAVDRVRMFGAPAEFRAYVGSIVSDFSNLRQDIVFGGGMTIRPTSNLAFELRDTRYTRNRLEAEVRWAPMQDLTLLGMYGFYDAKGRDSRFEAGYTIPELHTEITGGFYSRYNHDFRLDYITGQPSTQHRRDYLFLPQLAPSEEFYIRVDQPIARGIGVGGEYIRHRLRNGGDESPYDTDYDQINGYGDLEYGPLRFRTGVRYYHANRESFVLVVPRLPQPTVPTAVKQGERDHIEYHVDATARIAPGWSVSAGFVWNRVNYLDALSSVKHEQYADARIEIDAQLTDKVTLRFSYEHTRDAEYFNPYFERFQALTWILDVRM